MSPPDQIFRGALNAINDPLFILDERRACVFVNDAFNAFLKIGPGSLPTAESFWAAAKEYRSFQDEITAEFKVNRNETFLVKLEARGLTADKDCYLFRVISALSRSDPAAGFHSQRLEMLGILAGAVAHDFNNILTGILGHTTYLKTILPQAGPHVESLSAIEHGTRKGSSITQQILNFTKLDASSAVAPVLLSDVIGSTCSLLRRSVPPQISLQIKVIDPEVRAICSEAQLAQMVVNLVINARDAIEGAGEITVEISSESDASVLSKAFKGLELSSQKYAVLRVSDTGHGIAADLVSKIFEPYFSTKKGKGTGLGLATVASIVKTLGGAVTVDSKVKSGTRITIYLPYFTAVEGAAKEHGVAAKKLFRGSENVLVVDDEYPVRNVLVVSLQHLGYHVDAAASGKEALELFSKDPNHYHLVISDMLMPAMTGEQLFYELKGINPNVRVLLISGYSSEESIKNVIASGAVGFIPKPFTIEDLSIQVRNGLQEAK